MATMNDEHGTVEERPYVGDSTLVVATCSRCPWTNTYKGLSVTAAHKALVAHSDYKHGRR